MWKDVLGKRASISLHEEFIFWDTMPCKLVTSPPLAWKNCPHLLLRILNHYAHEHGGTETIPEELWEIITITQPYFSFPGLLNVAVTNWGIELLLNNELEMTQNVANGAQAAVPMCTTRKWELLHLQHLQMKPALPRWPALLHHFLSSYQSLWGSMFAVMFLFFIN